MSENKCPQCGAPLDPGATECKFCGEKLATQKAATATGCSSAGGAASLCIRY